ncbi:uncharacterized protein LOC141588024 [Silene latifolia]|uniref:uncharacterized protein LOC141588024 n=1 Tax=Silene latifolia TaxID=37657 RepID=UPI003D789410
MTVHHKRTNARFHVTMVYAFNGSNERQSLWANLSRLANNISGPWAIGGDFNCVLTEDERVGGSFSRQDADDFRQCLHQCEVIDSPAMGALYTWNNKQCPADRVYSRLDRFLVNQEWLNDYPLLLAPNFKETVQAGWTCMQTGTKLYELAKKLKNLKQGLKQLNRSRFADIETNAELAEAQNQFLQQKAKMKWSADGDANTSFFHGILKTRRRQNRRRQIRSTRNSSHR